MADNVEITAGSGTSVAADEVVDATLGTVKAQFVKIMDGTLDSTNKLVINSSGQVTTVVSAALPAGTNAIGKLAANSGVDIGDVDITSVIPGTGATNLGKAEDAAHTTGDVGVMALTVRAGAPTATSGTNGDYQPLITDTSGQLFTVEANSAAQLTALQLIDNLVLAEDAAHVSGDPGVQVLAVRSDTLAAKAGTTGDYSPIQVDAQGAVYTRVVTSAGASIDPQADDSSFTQGSGLISVIGAIAGANTVTANNAGALSMTVAGALHTTQKTDTSGGPTIFRSIDIDETEEEIKASAGQVYWIHAVNMTATPLYLKFYNATAANVTVGTTTPVLTFPVVSQGTTGGAGFVFNIPQGIPFGTAITVAATTGVADNDTGAPAANACVINIGFA